MKKFFLLSFVLFALVLSSGNGQFIRKVLVEEATNASCVDPVQHKTHRFRHGYSNISTELFQLFIMRGGLAQMIECFYTTLV